MTRSSPRGHRAGRGWRVACRRNASPHDISLRWRASFIRTIKSLDDLLGHPVAGASWEGYAVENLIGDGITATPLPALMRRLVEAR